MNYNPKKKALIVDDDAMSIAALSDMLQPAYSVHAVKKGRDGIRFSLEQSPDIVFLDVNMPDMDGFETLRKLKDNPHTACIPVIFTTGFDDEQGKERGMKLGASHYLIKPVKRDELLSILGNSGKNKKEGTK